MKNQKPTVTLLISNLSGFCNMRILYSQRNCYRKGTCRHVFLFPTAYSFTFSNFTSREESKEPQSRVCRALLLRLRPLLNNTPPDGCAPFLIWGYRFRSEIIGSNRVSK